MRAEFLKTRIDSNNASQLVGSDVLIIANQDKGRKLINKLPYNAFVELDYQEARYYPRLQAYWTMCKDIAENYKQPQFEMLDSKEKVDYYLRVRTGFVEFKIGNVIKPRSIAYDHCTEEDFRNYFESTAPYVEEITGIEYTDYRNRRNEG